MVSSRHPTSWRCGSRLCAGPQAHRPNLQHDMMQILGITRGLPLWGASMWFTPAVQVLTYLCVDLVVLVFQINGPLLPLLSMDELTCLGCGKAFDSQRHLSVHETLCRTHHEFSKQISKSYWHTERNHKIKKRKTNCRESFSGEEDAPQEICDMHAKNWHNQVCLVFLILQN